MSLRSVSGDGSADSLEVWPRSRIDTSVPHSARVWNFLLGGKDNYDVDREAAEAFADVFPNVWTTARECRHFVCRSVRFLAGEAGIRQFLDIGAGLPAPDNVHEIAQRVAPGARIVYVDNDAMVLAHARALLTGTPEGSTGYVDGDLRDPEAIVTEAAKTLDLGRPVAVYLANVLGQLASTEEMHAVVRRLMAAMPAGSYLVIADGVSSPAFAKAQDGYNASGAAPYHLRTPAEIAGFFTGLELVEPGVVSVPLWRPEVAPLQEPSPVDAVGGVGRKR